MSEAGNTKHAARIDDALAATVESEAALDLTAEEPSTPLPGALSEEERVHRSELAIALRPRAFPADRGRLLQVARGEQASDEVMAILERLPIDTRFDTVQDVWEAVGGHREVRAAGDAHVEPDLHGVPAPSRPEPPRPAPDAAPAPSILMLAAGLGAGGIGLTARIALAVVRGVRRVATRSRLHGDGKG